MIKFVKVSGYRSLIDFEVALTSGLNILVGPNGSGKTNIILFFEFLSRLISGDLNSAISRMGGAGVVFSKVGETQFDKNISVEIFGTYYTTKRKRIEYTYAFIIELSPDNSLIYYKRQVLAFKTTTKKENPEWHQENNIDWDFKLEQSITDKNKPKYKITEYVPRRVTHRIPRRIARENLENFISNISNKLYNESLVAIAAKIIEQVRYINLDLRGGETYSIIPFRVKQPEDIAREPGIRTDGSGLAATLHAIQKVANSPAEQKGMFYLFQMQRRFRESTLERISEYARLANPSILEIKVENNPFDNLLSVKVVIKKDPDNIVLPLSAMSDGTIKWITLITAITTSSSIFSIEEPENFLHPFMQSEIVSILRDAYSSDEAQSFVLMSTHSETLLNHAKPEELIIVSMKNGITKAFRTIEPDLINKEISDTGFGLGYYYLSGALSDD